MISEIIILGTPNSHSDLILENLTSMGYKAETVKDFSSVLNKLRQGDKLIILNDSDKVYSGTIEEIEQVREISESNVVILLSNEADPERLVKIANTRINRILELSAEPEAVVEVCSEYIKAGPTEQAVKIQSVKAPKPTHHIPLTPEAKFFFAQSTKSKEFLDKLWESFNYYHFTTIVRPRESDIDLVISELSSWKGDSDKKTLSISATEVVSQETKQMLEKLVELNKFSRVIDIHGLDKLDSYTELALIKFLLEEAPEFHSQMGIFFVFEVRQRNLNELKRTLNPLLAQELFTRTINLPQFCDRPSDLIWYIKNNLKSDTTLTEEALAILLTHSWPKNYTELQNFVTEANKSDSPHYIDGSRACEILGISHSEGEEAKLMLENVLTKHQNQLLYQAEKDLRFPELVNPEAHADLA